MLCSACSAMAGVKLFILSFGIESMFPSVLWGGNVMRERREREKKTMLSFLLFAQHHLNKDHHICNPVFFFVLIDCMVKTEIMLKTKNKWWDYHLLCMYGCIPKKKSTEMTINGLDFILNWFFPMYVGSPRPSMIDRQIFFFVLQYNLISLES